ncbi:MAG: hypothetical protein JNG85_01750, partial [Spirochaetaceae bacterium]|nr:hypothetical protein [Spirochaetaceae bacterium]
MSVLVMHNYYDKKDIDEALKSENKITGPIWQNYDHMLNKTIEYVNEYVEKYKNEYLEYNKWINLFEEHKKEFLNEMTVKNTSLYNDKFPWALSFFDYLYHESKVREPNEYDLFLNECGGINDEIMMNNNRVNEELQLPSEIYDKATSWLRNKFFNDKNKWIRKAEILDDILTNEEIDYYIMNTAVSYRNSTNYNRNINYDSIDLLFISRGHRFSVFQVWYQNYTRLDFDAHRNIVKVKSRED